MIDSTYFGLTAEMPGAFWLDVTRGLFWNLAGVYCWTGSLLCLFSEGGRNGDLLSSSSFRRLRSFSNPFDFHFGV